MFFNYIILLTVLILNSDRGIYKVVKDRESVATDPYQVQWCVGAMVQLCNISMVNNILLIHKKKKKRAEVFLNRWNLRFGKIRRSRARSSSKRRTPFEIY